MIEKSLPAKAHALLADRRRSKRFALVCAKCRIRCQIELFAKLSSVSSPDGKGLRLPGAGERDPSRRDDKVGEVDVNRPVMVVEFNE